MVVQEHTRSRGPRGHAVGPLGIEYVPNQPAIELFVIPTSTTRRATIGGKPLVLGVVDHFITTKKTAKHQF